MSGEKKREIELEKLSANLVTDPNDRSEVETLLSRFHPLGTRSATGRRLCYSVSYRGMWMAVLLFDAAVKRNKHREKRIGWSDVQREERLGHVANNSRYLLSPLYAGTPNLASKVLSLVTERISADWQRRYGIPLLAVETYVDPEHHGNEGTCYTAAGWENLGYSSGYQALGEERTSSKWYFLKALHRDSYTALRAEIPHALLTGVKEVSGKSNNNYVLDASKFNMKALQDDLSTISDPRGKQGRRYRFVPLLSLCVAAVVSGYAQYRQIADWIQRLPGPERARFGLPGDRVPDETTISQFLRKIDPQQLQTVLSQWLLKTYKKGVPFNSTIRLDGIVRDNLLGQSGTNIKIEAILPSRKGDIVHELLCQHHSAYIIPVTKNRADFDHHGQAAAQGIGHRQHTRPLQGQSQLVCPLSTRQLGMFRPTGS